MITSMSMLINMATRSTVTRILTGTTMNIHLNTVMNILMPVNNRNMGTTMTLTRKKSTSMTILTTIRKSMITVIESR
jgi:hypothetical protein